MWYGIQFSGSSNLLSYPKFYKKNLEICIHILLNKGYPLDLIFKLFNTRIKKLLSTKIPRKKDDIDVPVNNKIISNKKTFVLPFIHRVTQSATRMISKSVYVYNSIGYRCINKLNKFIKVHKRQKSNF